MGFKLLLVALCAAVVSGGYARHGYAPVAAPALAAVKTYVAPRAVSSYSSGVTHALAVQEHTVARPLAYGYAAAPAYGYAAPAVVAKTYAAPAVVAKTYTAPAYGYAAPAYGYAAPAYGYAAPAYGYAAPAHIY